MQTLYKMLPIDSLQRGQYQPREAFDEAALRDLADSILTQGLIEPLVVRQMANLRYEIIAGERRWRASIMAGLREVPCLIGTYTDQQAAAVTLIENIQREDLNLMEEATGYHRLQAEFHFSQDDIARVVGKSRSHIANLIRILSLCPFVQAKLRARLLSLGHARMLVGLSVMLQETLARQIEEQQWSVRQLEEEVRRHKHLVSPAPAPSNDRDIDRLQSQIAEQIGSPVQIDTDSDQGGWLKIKFFDNDTLEGLLERMGLRYD